MKIIYDSERDSYHRVELITDEGNVIPIGAYKIQVDDGGVISEVSRWGNAKRRDQILKKFKEELAHG